MAILWDVNNFQRIGASSNAAVGREFEEAAQIFFHSEGVQLVRNFVVPVGHRLQKNKRFDLGSDSPRSWSNASPTPGRCRAVRRVPRSGA